MKKKHHRSAHGIHTRRETWQHWENKSSAYLGHDEKAGTWFVVWDYQWIPYYYKSKAECERRLEKAGFVRIPETSTNGT